MKLPYLLLALALAASPAQAAKKHAHAAAHQAQPAADATPAQSAPAPAASNPNLPTPQAVPRPSAAPAGPGPTPPPPQIDAKSWVLMDYASGQILLGGNEDARVAPASITKVMTSYVVSAELKHGKIHLEDKVQISEKAWRSGGAGTDGSTSFLQLNSEVSLKDLLYGMIIQSGNDAAIALAEHTAGSEETFAQLMNQYAQQLGMKGTHYMDASGLPNPEHYTTARDIALMSRALIRDYPDEYKIYAIKDFEWNGIMQHNRNTLLWRDPSVDGIKTGHTAAAGYCLAASAKQGDSRMIAIVMGASSEKARADSAMALLNYGFRFYETHKLYDASKPLATPRLWKGATNQLPLGVADNVLVTVKRGQYDQLKATMDIPATLIAPFKKGQQVGTLRITLAGQPVQSVPLIAMNDAPQGGFFSRLWDSIMLWFHGDKKAAAEAPAKSTDAK